MNERMVAIGIDFCAEGVGNTPPKFLYFGGVPTDLPD